MLFRLLLVLSVLLAPLEGAPIFIVNPQSQYQIRIKEENVTVPPKPSEDTAYKIVIPAAILFVLAVIIGAIVIIYGCLKKKKPMKDVESQYCADNFRENNTNLNGKHGDYITYTIDDSPHGPGNEQGDVLTGNKISVPGPPDVRINNSPDEDEDTSSDSEIEIFCKYRDIIMPPKAGIVEVKESKINPDLDDSVQTPPSTLKGRNPMKNKSNGENTSFQESDGRNVSIYDSESSQPGREMRYFRYKQGFHKKNCLKKKKPMKDVESQYCADDFRENNTNLNGKHGDYITYTIDDSPHGPGNEQGDVLTGNKISVPGPPDVIISNSPDEDEDTSSDSEIEIFCKYRDIIMPHKAFIVEVKESKVNRDLDDYIQTPPSILKGRNPMKNKSKGENVSFQELDDRYVYVYDSESSQPGRQMRYFRNKQGIHKKKNPAGGENSTTTPLHGGYHGRISQPVMKQKRQIPGLVSAFTHGCDTYRTFCSQM